MGNADLYGRLFYHGGADCLPADLPCIRAGKGVFVFRLFPENNLDDTIDLPFADVYGE